MGLSMTNTSLTTSSTSITLSRRSSSTGSHADPAYVARLLFVYPSGFRQLGGRPRPSFGVDVNSPHTPCCQPRWMGLWLNVRVSGPGRGRQQGGMSRQVGRPRHPHAFPRSSLFSRRLFLTLFSRSSVPKTVLLLTLMVRAENPKFVVQ